MIGIIHIEDETFITDRNNEARTPVKRVDVLPTWDIDRAGSKGQVSVTADAGVLEPDMWLSTYRTITPERGEIIRFPRGHWHLSRPGIAYPGGHEMDTGNVAVMQSASGSDIVDDIAGVILTEPFYTPVGGHVLTDVMVLAKMATSGIIGTNLVPNGGFENGDSGWASGFLSGASGTVTVTNTSGGFGIAVPEGAQMLHQFHNPGTPTNGYAYTQRHFAVPNGAQFMYTMAVSFGSGSLRRYIRARYLDSAGNEIPNAGHNADAVYYGGSSVRHYGVSRVPDSAVSLRVTLMSVALSTTVGGTASYWDDVHAGTCTMMPLPDSRFDFPPNNTVATTRIQTAAGKSYGYDAINADRLNAIGYHAIATTMDGRLMTQPSRTTANATPRYVFGPDDIALLDVVTPEISAITEKPFNHWRAVKEDFQDATLSMAADSYNNNPNDPFSVVNSGSVRSAPPITVQDAVGQGALQAVADAARDRYSLSETVRFAIMPTREISVYDVVEIADPDMPQINGLWALNSIDASGDYLVITATRAVSREV